VNEFRLPDIGEGLTEAEVVRWVVAVGEPVGVDETVVEVETDKAVVEIPSPFAGVVLHHGAAEGEVVAVGEVLVVIGEAGEEWTADGDTQDEPEAVSEPEAEAEPEPVAEAVPEPAAEPEAGAESEIEAESEPVGEAADVAPIVGTLSEEAEELPVRADRTSTTAAATVEALPLVRKLAREHGLDLTSIPGSGPSGRVTRDDVMAVVEGRGEDGRPEPGPPAVPSLPEAGQETVPAPSGPERRRLTKLRRTIAANMAASWSEIPHVTTFDEVDAARLLELRRALGERHDMSIPLEALVVKAVVPVLRSHPEFNATLEGEDLVLHRRQDIGIAVDTADGLMVAVITDAARRSVLGLAGEVRRLGTGARERSLAASELGGQTFTISNIGAVGGGFGTPIVPHGTMAILSVGRAEDKPVARAGRVEVAPVMPLSLSYDHRVIDGGLGRRFMSELLENLTEPGLFLA
jgi:pyruvate dehydrogenase E2 component (dihydrolipoamide acetyltransferase)